MSRGGLDPFSAQGDDDDVRAERDRPRRRWSRRAWGAIVVAVSLLVAYLASGPILRSRLVREAERRNLEVTNVGAVSPGLLTVGVRSLRLRLKGVQGVEVQLDELRVDLTPSLALKEVIVRGGALEIQGEPEVVVEQLKAFRKGGGTAPAADGGSRTLVSASDVGLSWKVPSGGEISGTGLRLRRDADAIALGCARLDARTNDATLTLVGGELELAPDGAPRKIAAESLNVTHEPPRVAKAKSSGPASSGAEPVPPPLPPPSSKSAGRTSTAPAKTAARDLPPPPDEPVLPLPDLHALRARIAALATTIGTRLPEGTKVDIRGLGVKLDVGGEPVAFGPGPFTLERHKDLVRLGFSSEKAATGGTPLSIDAELPLGARDVTARLSGGPVSLALLGVKEGTKGLTDVGRGTVKGKGLIVLSATGDALTFDGQLALGGLAIEQPRLSREPLRGVELSVAARGVLDDGGRFRLDDAQLDMGALHVKTHGTVEETKDHFGLSLEVDVAPAACQALLDGAPQGLLPLVRQARMTGTFGATARVVFDTRTIDKLVFDYEVDDRCKITEVPRELSHDRFTGEFTYTTYHPDGKQDETTTGPGTPPWANLADISPYMVAAVLTTEDGAFYKHHGFNHNAIRNSVAANLKARRFIRGASTITMQLAKNLFLSRDKTLSRKIEEVVLTAYLEQIFKKDDMMELYLNVIEFGPDVYGVSQAAEYYFGRKPEELNVQECFFLASLLPSPVRFGKFRDKGELPDGWKKHVRALMEIAVKNGKITQADLAEVESSPLVFTKPGAPRPESRKVVPIRRRDSFEDDAAWQPLD